MSCHIIFRSCSEVYSYHTPGLKDYGRVGVGVTKTEIILRSLYTLIQAMNKTKHYLKLSVVDDHSSDECLEGINKLLENCKHPSDLINLTETGNGASLKTCYEMAKESDKRLIFFVEDDYLHHSDLLIEMFEVHEKFSTNFGKEIGLFPCDYPDNYTKPEYFNVSSWIALGKNRHWRTVTNLTCTFMCTKKIVNDYWQFFDAMSHYGEDGISEDTAINRIWQSGNAFMLAPIPSLSIHLHDGTKSPFVDWQDWWDKSDWRNKFGFIIFNKLKKKFAELI